METLNIISDTIMWYLINILRTAACVSLVAVIICTSITISIGALDDNNYGDIIIINDLSSSAISKTAAIASSQEDVTLSQTPETSRAEIESSIRSPSGENRGSSPEETSISGELYVDDSNNKNIFVLIISVLVLFVLINKYA